MAEEKQSVSPVFHEIKDSSQSLFSSKIILVLVAVILVGVGVGYMFSHGSLGSTGVGGGVSTSTSNIQGGQTYGSNDTSTFKDTAEGTLQTGGINGEGQFHLVRPGGDSQNVYLTSSIVDLSKFVGRKIKVWGQTNTAKYAGWLMDVGRVEVEK